MTLPQYAMSQANFPELYERWLVGPLFRPWVDETLDQVRLSAGDRLLDIACGTGIVARLASERLAGEGTVVGVDVSAPMLEVARRLAPDVDWRPGDAGALPLREGERFDAIVCQQGLQFFDDKPAAVAQMRRALAEDGRLAVATWRPDEDIPFFRDLRGVAERHLGPVVDQRYGFGDASALAILLREAGFREVGTKELSRVIRFDADAPIVRLNAMALVGMSAAGQAMSNEERGRTVDAIVDESASMLQPYRDGTGLVFELRTNLATASG